MAIPDPFAVLGLPRLYAIDREHIERQYLSRVADMHPDLIGAEAMAAMGGDDVDTAERASELNDARRILEDPEKRAIALWKLLGGVEDNALPPGFLMEMMEVRQEIEGVTTDTERTKWEGWVEKRRLEYAATVGRLFQKLETAAGRAEVLKAIKLELNAWRYIERLGEQL
jgi:molecular chaperone HscB